MYKSLLPAILLLLPVMLQAWVPERTDQTLWYNSPARQWEETLPLGNGRLGMMPDGGVNKETIVLNEISLWSGREFDYGNPKAAENLPEIQRLLSEGRNREAQALMYKEFVPVKDTEGGTYGTYQVLGYLNIDYPYADKLATDYYRWLDMSTATSYTTFTVDGVRYTREYFVPRGYDVIVMRISADKKGAVGFKAALTRKHDVEDAHRDADGIYTITGHLKSGDENQQGMGYTAAIRVLASGDEVKTMYDGADVKVSGADEAWIAVAGTTDYWQRIGITDLPTPEQTLKSLTVEDLNQYKHQGIINHRSLYGRAGVNFAKTEQSALPTNERIEAFVEGSDPELAALYYNFGRYLLISSTLPGFLPPNLQGLWANTYQTPWNGDYHTNINVQMNHWPVEQGNLSELHMPLIRLVQRAVPSGERTAKAFYGPNAEGWVMHMMTNVWNYTEPGEHPSWGATNTGGAWLTAHMMDHYLYNPTDTAYLREIYPVLKGASKFFLSTMVTEPKHGWLVTSPSSSPENSFFVDGEAVSVCMGPTMDTQIVNELFNNVITAASILGIDKEYTDSLEAAIAKLPPMQIGKDGRLMEWLEEYTETDPQHRHVSHLYGLHPSNQISPVKTPELAEAARLTLEGRGDAGTGWSRAWKINFWDRLGDGNRAYKLFKALMYPAYTADSPNHKSGTFPNLFCSHAPFQIDGNWGGTSGISEMLVQSHDGYINLLPALPDELSEGSLFGFRTRGGATVDIVWADKLPTHFVIDAPSSMNVKMPQGVKSVNVNGKSVPVADGFITVPAGVSDCIVD